MLATTVAAVLYGFCAVSNEKSLNKSVISDEKSLNQSIISHEKSLDKRSISAFGFAFDSGGEEARGDVGRGRFTSRFAGGFRRRHRKQVAGSWIRFVREVTHLEEQNGD